MNAQCTLCYKMNHRNWMLQNVIQKMEGTDCSTQLAIECGVGRRLNYRLCYRVCRRHLPIALCTAELDKLQQNMLFCYECQDATAQNVFLTADDMIRA